jgi:hypothetical protein
MAINLASPEAPTVVELTVPATGGTAAGTLLVEVEPDAEVEVTWPWPDAWPLTSS